jgi:hypothetical protein
MQAVGTIVKRIMRRIDFKASALARGRLDIHSEKKDRPAVDGRPAEVREETSKCPLTGRAPETAEAEWE